MYNFTPARPALVNLSEFYGQVVAIRPLSILPEVTVEYGKRTNVPRVEVITVSDEGIVKREGVSLALPKGLQQPLIDAFKASQTLVGRLNAGQHPTNAEWTLVQIDDLTPEEAPAVFAALEAWASAGDSTSTVPADEEVPF